MKTKKIWQFFIGLIMVCITVANLSAQKVDPLAPDYSAFPKKDWEKKFDAFQFKVFEKDGHCLPYRFYVPEGRKHGVRYPLVIFFHGAGERGNDNRTQFKRFAPTLFWQKYPCYVVAPECPDKTEENTYGESVWVDTPFGASSHQMKSNPTWPMHLAIILIDKIIKENKIDRQRIYVTGLSMGGFATWEILQRNGSRFAAAIPVCGGGDPAFVTNMGSVPLWVFHGDNDQTVPVSRSKNMVGAIRVINGNVKYTEYPGGGHNAWDQTYGNQEVWDWLFSQKKK